MVHPHLVLRVAEAFGRRCSMDQPSVGPDGKIVGLPLMLVDDVIRCPMSQHLLQQVQAVRPAHAFKVMNSLSTDQNSWLCIVRVLQHKTAWLASDSHVSANLACEEESVC